MSFFYIYIINFTYLFISNNNCIDLFFEVKYIDWFVVAF